MDLNNLDLYRDLLATVIQSRMQMDAASARADLLLNIFDITVDNPGDEARFVERTINPGQCVVPPFVFRPPLAAHPRVGHGGDICR